VKGVQKTFIIAEKQEGLRKEGTSTQVTHTLLQQLLQRRGGQGWWGFQLARHDRAGSRLWAGPT
jgi:hypothetical protein